MLYTYEQREKRLENTVTLLNKGPLDIISKNIPFFEKSKGLDAKAKEHLQTVDPSTHRPRGIEDLEAIRSGKDVENKNLSTVGEVETKHIHLPGRTLKIRIYNRSEEVKPALVYFHGGGFFERGMDVMENPCRLLAQKAGAVVVAIEYRLAPEFPYRQGLDDCLEGVRYVYEEAASLSINPELIGLVGDSVGGNLALGVDHLSQDEEWNICYVGLLCPLVDLSDISRQNWKIDHYDMSKDEPLIRRELLQMRESLFFIQTLYLKNLDDVLLPLVSPLLSKEKHELPAVTMITAEFDFLRIQGEDFSAQLLAAGVPVRHIEYKGMHHAFVKLLGYYPQAADAVKEIAGHFSSTVSSYRSKS
ncbi:alpha/beta hydrolase [Alkalicoccus halolimnae]|uniref:Alpha/beta hydrolase n=1 Tax=Alkalicoccus halolimnae TaxID=1667239 RepID=A0AAJ8LUB2_9BACI|nr:alpha/beta hydrolase [Alkalicoccus halolimnae]